MNVLGMIMVGAGLLMAIGMAAFVALAIGFRHSFTSSDVPLEDMLEGLLMLSPCWLFAAALIFFGLRQRKV